MATSVAVCCLGNMSVLYCFGNQYDIFKCYQGNVCMIICYQDNQSDYMLLWQFIIIICCHGNWCAFVAICHDNNATVTTNHSLYPIIVSIFIWSSIPSTVMAKSHSVASIITLHLHYINYNKNSHNLKTQLLLISVCIRDLGWYTSKRININLLVQYLD